VNEKEIKIEIIRENNSVMLIKIEGEKEPHVFAMPEHLTSEQKRNLLSEYFAIHLQKVTAKAEAEASLRESIDTLTSRTARLLLNAAKLQERSRARPPALAETAFLFLASEATVDGSSATCRRCSARTSNCTANAPRGGSTGARS
jgi:hypothetical protein